MLQCLNELHHTNLDVFMASWRKVNVSGIFGVRHTNRGQTKYGIHCSKEATPFTPYAMLHPRLRHASHRFLGETPRKAPLRVLVPTPNFLNLTLDLGDSSTKKVTGTIVKRSWSDYYVHSLPQP